MWLCLNDCHLFVFFFRSLLALFFDCAATNWSEKHLISFRSNVNWKVYVFHESSVSAFSSPDLRHTHTPIHSLLLSKRVHIKNAMHTKAEFRWSKLYSKSFMVLQCWKRWWNGEPNRNKWETTERRRWWNWVNEN